MVSGASTLLLQLALLFLFILLVTIPRSLGARGLLEKTGHGEEDQLVISHGGALENADGFLAMDYTPSKANRPVHN
ncbi:hypothetical protein SDJN03_02600, partial [Cucurbita argyrosperma subsp. sororia]